jgi:hypothetical protein
VKKTAYRWERTRELSTCIDQIPVQNQKNLFVRFFLFDLMFFNLVDHMLVFVYLLCMHVFQL